MSSTRMPGKVLAPQAAVLHRVGQAGAVGIVEGEDVYFCTMARVHGFEVWVDHDLSKEVTHIGQFEYGWT